MKQRLLLALLMLFSSVGFMKAQAFDPITIGVPKDAKVTITLTSSSFTFTSESYPQLYSGSDVVTPEGGVDKLNSKTVKWILEPEATTNYELSTATNDDSWGNLSLSLDGKVTSFVVSGAATNKFQELITSLSFTNNGVLEQLVLASKNAYKTTGLPKLASLSCAGNKLNYIPSKLGDDGKVKLTTYNVGEQSPSSTRLTTVNVTEPKNGLTLNTSSFDQQTSKIFSETVTGALTISELKDKDGKVVNYAMLESGKYFFKNGDIFMDGDFTAKIAVGSDDKNYPGVVICGVPVTVNPATFELKAEKIKITPEGAGSIVSDPTDLSGLKREQVIKLTPKYNSGYEFEKFQNLVGLESVGQDGNTYSFKVLGDKDPEIEAVFKAKGATVTYNTPDAAQGTLRVTKAENNELVASGNTVPVGTKLLITAKAKDGYQVEDGNVSFKMADKSTSVIEDKLIAVKTDASEKTWTYEVTIDGLDVQAAFKGLSYSLKNASSTQNITIKDIKGTSYSWNTEKSAWEIPVNTELIFTYSPSGGDTKVVSSVVINSKSYEVTQMQDGKFTWKGFVMPNEESSMTVTLSELKSITVNLVKNEFAYNGQEQKVDFTVNKNVDKTSFKVEYKEKTADANTYTEKAFANEGEYTARITRPADGEYAACQEEIDYVIVKAQLIVEAPTVNVDKDGNISFTNVKAYFMNGDQKDDVVGKFVAVKSDGTTEITNIKDNNNGEGKLKVTYKVTDASVAANLNKVENFILQYGEELATAKIQAVGEHKGDLTFTMNSVSNNKPMVLPDGSSVAVGTEVEFKITKTAGITDDSKYKVYQANAKGEKLSGATDLRNSGYKIAETDKVQTLYFLLEVEDKRTELALSDQAKKYFEERDLTYSGESLKDKVLFSKDNTPLVKKGTVETQTNDAIYSSTKVTYWKDGKEVKELIDAGTYTVKMERDASESYLAFSAECTITIKKATLKEGQVPDPSASEIGKGQPLSTSKLTGQATIAGKYDWDEKYKNEILTKTDKYPVIFYPADDNNYESLRLTNNVEVKVSNKPILTITCDESKGTVKVYDGDGNYYYDGDAIDVNKLTFEADPAEGYAFESYVFTKGGFQSIVKDPQFTTSPDGSSMDIAVNFKEKSAETVYHTISFSSLNVAGVVFNNVSTSNKVKEGDSFNFSMSAHPSDCSRIVVKDNKGKSYAVSSLGACTVSNVQEDLQLTVSLSNPTKYTVTLPAEYKDSEGNLMGTANFSGNTYYGGTITLTAVPKEGYKFVGWLNAGTTSTAETVQVTVTSNMTISARFESDGTIDPNTECIVRTPYDEDVAGIHINKQGINVVKIGSDFEFTVDAYEDDLKNVKVTVDGAELKPTSENKYVISKVKKNTEVKVTLANPTRIKVVVEKETKNAKGYVMGHVDVEGLFSDSTCYYNTTIRLAAYPESGVEFMNWSDVTSNTQLIRELTITKELTIKPVFSGTPTGIEDIMAASITTGRGYVWVRGIANADVTIVSISGRVQARQRISGDTQINVPAGIYVVVLESGSDVKRAKVIVK